MTQPQLGKQISELRIRRGLTQQELADQSNLNIRTIQRIEAGEVVPRMYTLNLLKKPLKMDLSQFAKNSGDNKMLSRQMRRAFIAGLISSINSGPLIFDLITQKFGPIMHITTLVVHTLTCIFFYAGFYRIGRFYKNKMLAIPALIMLIFLPAINVLEILKEQYFSIGQALLFILMCINLILFGAGLIKEAFERKGYENSTIYKVAGIATILITVLYLSLNTTIMHAGLVLSAPLGLLMVYILYKELNNTETIGDDRRVLT